MKKILSVILLVLFTCSISVISMAAGQPITQDSEGKSSNITVSYNAGATYTVTIPASVTFSDNEKQIQRSLAVSDLVLNEGSSLHVKLTSLNDFKMVYGAGYIDYYLMINTQDFSKSDDDTILTVPAGQNSGWVILDFMTNLYKDHIIYTGNYTDTLTFTVVID